MTRIRRSASTTCCASSGSPMSIGTYVLMSFGFCSLVAFVVQASGLDLIALQRLLAEETVH